MGRDVHLGAGGDPDGRRLSEGAGIRISLIVVNYGQAGEVERLLTALDPAPGEVIVVDNPAPGVDPAAIEQVVDRHRAARLVRSPTNRGYGAGCNLGAAVATGDVLVVSNPDVAVRVEDLCRLAAAVGEGVALAAPRFRRPDGSPLPSAHDREPRLWSTLWSYCRPFGGLMSRLRPGWNPTLLREEAHGSDRDVLHVLGALMAIDAQAFRAVGGFDEGFFLYREETDLCRRLRQDGYRVRHLAAAEAVHVGDTAAPSALRPPLRPTGMASHYRYLAKHEGLAVAVVLRLVGLLGSVLWRTTGPDRADARAALHWHFHNIWRDPRRAT